MNNTKESTIKVVRDERGRFTKNVPTPRPFKVGDVVRRLDYFCSTVRPGTIGTVISAGESISVQWNGNSHTTDYYDDHHKQLELVPNAPKQRKTEKKSEAPKFKIGDMVTGMSCVRKRATGEIIKIDNNSDGMRYKIRTADRWEPWMMDKGLKKVISVDIDLAVPEEIPAALQTLAKAFGYRVEKA